MRRYLGNIMSAYAAIIIPLFIIGPIVFAILSLRSVFSFETIIISMGCLCCSLVFALYIKSFSRSLYSWGILNEYSIIVKSILEKPYTITYSKCKSCGIGYYLHSVLNRNWGSKHYYIFISYDRFDESFRNRMNYYKQTTSQFKVPYTKSIYLFLISVLPHKLANNLQQDYNRYFANCHDPM